MKKLLLFCVTIFCNVAGVFAQCVTPSLASVSTGAAVCAGSTLNLNASGPANVTGYSWTGPNSFTSTLQNPSISSATTAAGGVYSVMVVNGTGTCSATYTVQATVDAPPVSSYVTNQNPICRGTQMVISPASAWCDPFALNCNGVNSTGSTAAPISTAIDNVTMEAWVEWNGGGDQIIFWNGNSAGNGYSLQIVDGSGTLYIVLGGVANLSTTAQLTLGVRQHVAVVRTAGTWSVYVNGVQYPVAGGTATPITPTAGFYLGNNTEGTNAFNGLIGNVAFWTIARSTTQIQADMNSCSQSPQTGLAAYWGLGDGSGTSITDASGNGNTLTLAHTTWHSAQVSTAYVWNFGDGTSGVTGSAPAHTYTAAGTYTVGVTSSVCSGTASKVITVDSTYVIQPVSGSVFICAGYATQLSETTSGGTWSSSATAVATVSTTGMVTGIAAGTANISYTKINSCGVVVAVSIATVNPLPAPGIINGPNTVCTGVNITLSDTASAGIWSSSATGIATIGSTGIVTGIGAGATIISYTKTNSYCSLSATMVMSVSLAASAGSIAAYNVCAGSSTSVYDGVGGGVWSSGNTAVANIDASGNLSGVAAGTATISYSVTTCNTAIATANITVNALPLVTFTEQPSPPVCTSTPVTYTTQPGQSYYAWTISGGAGTDYLVTGGSTDDTSYSVTLQWLTSISSEVSVNYVDSNGCTSSTSNAVTISSAPVTSYYVSPTPSCAGTPIAFVPQGGAWCYDLAVFTGGDGTIQDYGDFPMTDNLVIEAWIQWTGTSYSWPLNIFLNGSNYEYNYGYALDIADPSGTLEIELPGVGYLVSNAKLTTDRTHVAIVRSSGVWSIYMDGVEYPVTNNTQGPIAPEGGFCVGCGGSVLSPFSGVASNVAIWSTARSTAQIQGDMNSCSLAPQSGLAGYWPLKDGATWSEDASGNGNPMHLYYSSPVSTISSTDYYWDFGDGGIAVGDAPVHAYAAAGAYTVNITSELCGGSSTVLVNVIDTLPSQGVISGTNSICPGASTLLSDIAPGGVWTCSNTGVATINSSGSVSAITPGTTTISYSVTNACGTNIATNIMTVDLTIPVFTTAPPAQVCPNTNVTYATVSGQGDYIWNVGGTEGTDYIITGGGTGTMSSSVTLQWLTGGTKIVSINYTGSNGCNAITPARDTIDVATPNVTFSATPTCAGISATLVPNSSTCSQPSLNFSNGASDASMPAPVTTATDNITIEAWVLWNGGSNQMIFLNGNTGFSGYGLYIGSGGQLQILMGYVVFATSSATLPQGVRTHVAIVRNSGTWSVYVNSTSYPISSPGATPLAPGSGFFVGCDQSGGSTFSGTISNLAFWNIARNSAQIASDMDSCTLSPQARLIGYWTLADGSGTVAHDASGYGHNLEINNPNWSPAISSYSWSFGDGTTSTAYSPAHTYTAMGIYTPTLTVVNTAGCTGSATIALTVNATPGSTTITGTQAVCLGSTQLLSDSATGGVWSSTNSSVATIGTNGLVTGLATGTAVISYTITNNCGIFAAGSIVTVNSPTSVTFTTAPGTAVCGLTPVTYTTQAGQTDYIWSVPGTAGTDYTINAGGTGEGSNSVTLEWADGGSKTVTVNYTAATGCMGLTPASNTTTVNILPTVLYCSASANTCMDSAATFFNNNSCNTSSLNFNGSNSSATYNSPVSTAINNVTLEAWVQWNGGANQTIFINGNAGNSGYALFVADGSGTLQMLLGGVAYLGSSVELQQGVMTHVAIVCNGGAWSLYVNGVQYALTNATSVANTPNTAFVVGNDGGGATFNGVIRNVAFWNLARSTAQIQADMASCAPSPQTGLAGFWALGEGSGTTAYDASGNGHNLALSHTSWTTAPAYTYLWSFGDGSTATGASPAHAYSVAGDYTASVTMTNGSGCSLSAMTIVTINAPIVPGAITGAAVSCIGNTNALSDASAGGVWSSSNTSVAIVSTTGIVTGSGVGTALISYTLNNGCVTSATTTETVNTTVSVFTTAPSTPVCAYVPVTYAAPAGQTNYIWMISGTAGTDYIITAGGTGAANNSVTLEWQAVGTNSVMVGYTGTNGCGPTTFASTTTTVNAAPDPQYFLSTNPICLGNSVSFTSEAWCTSSVLNFNGGNGVESIVPVSTAVDNVTLEAWVQWNGGADEVIFLNGNVGGSGYGLHIFNASGQMEILMGGVVFSQSSATIAPGVRTHVAMVRNSGTWYIYLNGVPYSIDDPTATPNPPTTGFFVGSSDVGSPFNGIISNVAFWTIARSTVQIQADMFACSQSPQPGLAGYWQLGEGSGSEAYDSSGNDLNLSISLSTWITSPTNGYTYNWDLGDGSTDTLERTTHIYSATGTYNSTLTVGNGTACTTMASVAVSVNSTPSIAAIGGNTALCQASAISLSDVTAGGVWTSADSIIATVDSFGNITGIAAGTTTISYTVNNGCQASATAIVTVNGTSPSFISAPPANLCVGYEAVYTTQPGETNYTWTISGVLGTDYNITAGGTGSTSNSVTLTWLTTGSDIVTVNYTGSNGCIAPMPAADTTIIGIGQPDATFLVNPNPVCASNIDSLYGYNGWCYPNVADLAGYGYGDISGYTDFSGLTATNEFTFESWVQWNGDSYGAGIFSYTTYRTEIGLSTSPTGHLQMTLSNPYDGRNTIVSGAILPVNQRAHVAVTFSNANGWTIYLNGVAYPIVSTLTPQIPEYIAYTQNFYLGLDYTTFASFNGLMGNTAYWTTPRDSFITADMNACSLAPQTGLAAYWPLNEGTGNTGYDSSGNGHNIPLYAAWKNTATLNTYTWSFGDGITGTGGPAAHTYTAPGVYTASVIATDGAGCSTTATKLVTVNPAPAITSASAGPVCAGGILNLFANTPTNVIAYSWAGPDSFSASSQNPSVSSATTAANGTYTVTLTGGGCVASYTTTATVNAVPVLASAFAPSLACIGGILSLHADTPSSVTGYAWSGPNSFSSTSANPVLGGLTTAASGVYSVTVNNGTGSGCSASYTTIPVQVITIPVIGPISGSTNICGSSTSLLSDTTYGGDWFSTDPSIASVDETTGVVTGMANGTVDIGYAADNLCGINERFVTFTVNSGTAPISGANSICAGGSAMLSDVTAGGVWSSSNTSIATVNGSTGNVTGVTAGTVTITYSTGSCSVTALVTVNASGSAGSISGTATTCTGATTALTDATSGGVWSSGNTSIATVGSTGVVTGVAAGATTISYSENNTCGSESASLVVTVNALPNAGSISGPGTVCASATITLSDVVSSGAWSSGNTSVATVGSLGLVMGIAAGTSIISYAVGNSCGTAYTSAIVTVNPSSNAGSISGTGTLCQGSTTDLTDGATGGAWSSGNSSMVIVGSSGIVTGVAVGTATISYAVSGSCGNAYTTTIVTVNATFAGTIAGPSSVTAGSNIALTDVIAGGTWSASNTNASVSGGIVTGVTAGTVTISYAVSGVCGTSYATELITVNNVSLTGISGNASLCSGGTTVLTDATSGGTWSMGSLVATVVGSTGVVTASNTYTGTATVTYTVGIASATVVITVNPNPTLIQGLTSECAGATVVLTDATPGGVWTATGDASVSGAGSVCTLTANSVSGSATVTYTLPTGCMIAEVNTIYANPLPISGVFNVCVGGIATLTDASAGANWSSSNSTVAIASGPSITGQSAGTATITFTSNTAGYCYATQVVTVSPQPAAIAGNTGPICPGTTLLLIDGTGLWSSSNTLIATVGSTGSVTGISGGIATITYFASGASGCIAKTIVTVNTTAAITGTGTVCPGGTVALHDAIAGGAWSSGATTIATISVGGVVTGVAPGTANITYTTTTGCMSTLVVTVSGLSTAISGNMSLCQGASTTLSDATSGGTWSMSSIVASVVGSTGVVTASASTTGTATISYTVGGCSVTGAVTVNAKPMPIQGSSAECAGITISLTDATAGGAWSGAGDAVVTGSGAAATLVAGAVGGTATVTYTVATGCYATATNTIYAKPQPIMGNFNMCVGLVTILSDASPVSSWSSSNTTVAVASGADISGEGAGTATITFKTSATGNCTTTQVVTVNAMPAVTPINGPATISRAASPVSISDATAGGIWTSSNTSVITLSGSTGSPIGATAVMTTGSSVVTYAVTISGCTTKVTKTFSAATAPHPPTGTATVYAGSSVSLDDEVTGGIWSSSDNSIATVDGNGLVRGIVPGSVRIDHDITDHDNIVATNATIVMVTAMPVSISVSPNPNKGAFTVKGTMGSSTDEVVTLEVMDLLGEVIYRNKVTAENGKLNETIILSKSLANGMYLLNVQSGAGNNTFHFVVEQ